MIIIKRPACLNSDNDNSDNDNDNNDSILNTRHYVMTLTLNGQLEAVGGHAALAVGRLAGVEAGRGPGPIRGEHEVT